jgi:SpoVK/Ycf46/Vps4 family AAA+-type ATPase
MRRHKLQTVANIYEEEVVLSAYYYLNKILTEFDLNSNLDSHFLSMFDQSAMNDLVNDVFKPFQEKFNEQILDPDEKPSYMRNRRYRDERELFDSLQKSNFTLGDIENDISTYKEKQENGDLIIIDFILSVLEKSIEKFDITQTNTYLKVDKTFESLGLKKKYIPLVHFLGILSEFPVLGDWLDMVLERDTFIICVSKVTGLSKSEIYRQTTKKSKFTLFGILEEHARGNRGNLEITSRFSQYLIEPGQETFGMRLLKENKETPQELSSFFLPSQEKDRLRALLREKNSAKILLYGSPGSGKTEFAKSLAHSIGSVLLRIDTHDAEDTEERRAALVVGELSTRENGGILLMDESDDLLNEGKNIGFFFGNSAPLPEKKIWMNEFLDNIKGRVIFITNEYYSIHESVRRRFDYSLQFHPADQKQREYYWNRVLDLEGVKEEMNEETVQDFSEIYPVGVGGITSSVRSTKKICSTEPNHKFTSVLQDVLNKHVQLLGGKIQKSSLSRSPYDVSILNTDADLSSLEALVKNYKEELDSSDFSNLGSLCILLYGKPGTGKTEYARYLAKHLKIEIVQKRSSDLQSMWLGMTEKNIASAFQEAEKKKAIFFLDEADSFLRSRELATRSYEGSQTNEFLTWMESFRGIFIASTNFLKDFDPAVLRRFAWKGEFKPLTRDNKVKLLMKYFPGLEEKFSSLQLESIKDIPELTPGDYKALWNKMRYKSIESISTEEIVTGLKIEVSFKAENQNKIAGF